MIQGSGRTPAGEDSTPSEYWHARHMQPTWGKGWHSDSEEAGSHLILAAILVQAKRASSSHDHAVRRARGLAGDEPLGSLQHPDVDVGVHGRDWRANHANVHALDVVHGRCSRNGREHGTERPENMEHWTIMEKSGRKQGETMPYTAGLVLGEGEGGAGGIGRQPTILPKELCCNSWGSVLNSPTDCRNSDRATSGDCRAHRSTNPDEITADPRSSTAADPGLVHAARRSPFVTSPTHVEPRKLPAGRPTCIRWKAH